MLTVADAAGKLPPGVLKGNINWLGNYKECISAEFVPGVNDTRHGFTSHYCVVAIGVQLAVSYTLFLLELIIIISVSYTHLTLPTNREV